VYDHACTELSMLNGIIQLIRISPNQLITAHMVGPEHMAVKMLTGRPARTHPGEKEDGMDSDLQGEWSLARLLAVPLPAPQ
jgi:hypothetical protein